MHFLKPSVCCAGAALNLYVLMLRLWHACFKAIYMLRCMLHWCCAEPAYFAAALSGMHAPPLP